MAEETEYTITIENSTGDSNEAFSYIAFGFPHTTSATRGTKGLPVVFWRSLLQNDEQGTFTITSANFAFLGNASQTNASLTAGATVSLTKKVPVTLGGRAGDGSEVDAKPKGASVEFTKSSIAESAMGSFSIIASRGLKENNQYAVGLARQVKGKAMPIVAFGLHPGQTFDITPVEAIYIARQSATAPAPYTVVSEGSFALKAEVRLLPDQPTVTVTDAGSGTSLKVEYN